MGYNLKKRLSVLKQQVDENDAGRIGFTRAVILSSLLLFATVFVLRLLTQSDSTSELAQPPRTETSRLLNKLSAESAADEESLANFVRWKRQTEDGVADRVAWLHWSPISPGAAGRYERFAQALLGDLTGRSQRREEGPLDVINFDGWYEKFHLACIGALLRIGFILFSFWPLWVLGMIGGFVAVRTILKHKLPEDVLGICHRGNGPFYSGIYGPLKPNGSFSGSDFAAPSLACPAQEKKHLAITHDLVRILRNHSAFNETNLGLVQVILAYKDYPSFVDEEHPAEDEAAADPKAPTFAPGGLFSAEDGTIEARATEGLAALLDVHRVLLRYFGQLNNRQQNTEPADPFPEVRAAIEHSAAKLSPLSRTLLLALTPARAQALTTLSPSMIASGYLSIEAGKSLVFKRAGTKFTQVSRFPHLQARAVLQSLTPFHNEYSGDVRLILRQAIICSRRHGDFGRAFLPYNMPLPSRALRDLLEIFYGHPDRRADIANMVELDAHVEELSINWRHHLSETLRSNPECEKISEQLWKGIAHKSVVLFPLRSLTELALLGMSSERQQHVLELMKLTRKLQASMSISARLPGFKRQAEEAEKSAADSGGVTQVLSEAAETALVDRWLILRRMLTRYNWLSTRVGDDAVPVDGLLQAILLEHPSMGNTVVHPLDALVPLRQRRFKELLGPNWERTYYWNAPHPNDLEIYVDNEEFRKAVVERQGQAEKGDLNLPNREGSFAAG